MSIATFALGPLATNSFIVSNGNLAAAIDVGGDPGPMLAYLEKEKLALKGIYITHLHFDHLYGVASLSEATKAPVFTPEGDYELAKGESAKGGMWGMPPVPPFESQPLPLGKTEIAGLECFVLQTPGHTPGGVSLYFPSLKSVFTGDALFYRSLGRTDFPGGSHQTLLKSIREKLFTLPDDTTVYPGHGPSTTIGEERLHNPFCGEFAM